MANIELGNAAGIEYLPNDVLIKLSTQRLLESTTRRPEKKWVDRASGRAASLKRLQKHFRIRSASIPPTGGRGWNAARLPNAFTPCPTIVVIDLEWVENTKHLTQVGMMKLQADPDLMLEDKEGEWQDRITSCFLLVEEYRDFEGGAFAPTNPHNFAFGETNIVPAASIPERIRSFVFETESDIVLTFHDGLNDLKRLAEIGFIPENENGIIDVQDTSRLPAAVEHHKINLRIVEGGKKNVRRPTFDPDVKIWAPSLSLCLSRYVGEVPEELLHNAGNDSMYTTLLLLSLVKLSLENACTGEFFWPWYTGDDGGRGCMSLPS